MPAQSLERGMRRKTRSSVGPVWPPNIVQYEYLRTLPKNGWAWEFLRRNSDYQRDYRLSAAQCASYCRHRSGISLCRLRRRCRKAEVWGLCSFRRSL